MGYGKMLAGAALVMAVAAPNAVAQGGACSGVSKASETFVQLYNGATAAAADGEYALARDSAIAAAPHSQHAAQTDGVNSLLVQAYWHLGDMAGLETAVAALKESSCATAESNAALDGYVAELRKSQ